MTSKRTTHHRARADRDANLDDPRVIAAVKQYLAALESGRVPLRSEFLARHAEIAPELLPCLAGLELVHRAAVQMRHDASDPPLALPTDCVPLAFAVS